MAELTGRHGNLLLVDAAGVVRYQAVARRCAGATARPRPALDPAARRLAGRPSAGRRASSRWPAPPSPGRWPWSGATRRSRPSGPWPRRRRRLREPLRAAAARSRRALEKLADEAARVPGGRGRPAGRRPAQGQPPRRGARRPPGDADRVDRGRAGRGDAWRSTRRSRRARTWSAATGASSASSRARRASRPAPPRCGPGWRRWRRCWPASTSRRWRGWRPIEREARRLAAGPRPAPRPRRRRDQPLPPYRTFRSLAGLALLVGRGAAENDQLTRTRGARQRPLAPRPRAGRRARGDPAGRPRRPTRSRCSTPPTWRPTSPTPAASRRSRWPARWPGSSRRGAARRRAR